MFGKRIGNAGRKNRPEKIGKLPSSCRVAAGNMRGQARTITDTIRTKHGQNIIVRGQAERARKSLNEEKKRSRITDKDFLVRGQPERFFFSFEQKKKLFNNFFFCLTKKSSIQKCCPRLVRVLSADKARTTIFR
jgi:hypothetical protein